LASTVGISPHS